MASRVTEVSAGRGRSRQDKRRFGWNEREWGVMPQPTGFGWGVSDACSLPPFIRVRGCSRAISPPPPSFPLAGAAHRPAVPRRGAADRSPSFPFSPQPCRTGTRAAAKGSRFCGAKGGAMAYKVGVRFRSALRDIGNSVAYPNVWAARGATVKTRPEQEPGTGAVPAAIPNSKAAANEPEDATEEEMMQTAPESQSELEAQSELQMVPSQLVPQFPNLTETKTDDSLCQAFSHVLLAVEDEDVKDGTDQYLCSDYVKDIYNYQRELEENQPVRPEYLSKREITKNMRAELVDWLVQTQVKFRLQLETLYLAVGILDRYLQDNPVSSKAFQLVGVAALFIASKYEEVQPPSIGKFVCVADRTCARWKLRQMERKILQALDFSLGLPLPVHFLRRVSKIAKMSLKQNLLSRYLMELCIVDYDMVHFPPSKIAAAASCLALKLLGGFMWTPALQNCTSYTENDLFPVMQHMAKNVILVNKGKIKEMAVKVKYSINKNMMISTIDQLQGPIIRKLGQPLIEM
ncbi:G2/mitotic-specific cyclin-B1 [Calypte anna]|uniref:G2/mitotic-specific cyclin-B1 n=1 Tax=Calypte anna TaxID=9244 RepID=UPI0011C4200C|nr:G2/mitotic-specific cyclin-B1 [Calypte anna]